VRAARPFETRRHRRRLTEVAPEPHQAQPRPRRGRLAEAIERAVTRPVVDDQDLGGPPGGFQLADDVVERGRKPRDRLLLVETGNDDRNLWEAFRHGAFITRRAGQCPAAVLVATAASSCAASRDSYRKRRIPRRSRACSRASRTAALTARACGIGPWAAGRSRSATGACRSSTSRAEPSRWRTPKAT